MNRRRSTTAAALVVGLVGLLWPGVDAGAQTGGGPIRSVEIFSDRADLSARELYGLITLTEGGVYSAAELRRSIRNLHAAQQAGEVEAYIEPLEGGVAIRFALWSEIVVQEVELIGDLAVKMRDLERLLEVRAGHALVEDQVLRSLYGLQDFYRAEGYLGAQVRLEVEVDETLKAAVVRFRVTAGQPTLVGAVEFDGDLGPYPASRLVDQLRLQPGARLREAKTAEDATRLRHWLISEGYRMADVQRVQRVQNPPETSDIEALEAQLVYLVTLGPLVEVEVRGADLAKLHKKDLLPFLGREGYDSALVLEAVARLRRHYQSKGHYQAQIDWSESRETDRLVIELDVDPGPVFKLQEVTFEGNEFFTSERLLELVQSGPRRFLAPGSGRLVDEVFEADLRNVKSFYALQGFPQAQVGPPEVVVTGRALRVRIPISAGERQRVVNVWFDGVKSLDPRGLLEGLPIRPTGPFHPRLLDDAITLIQSRYEDLGYAGVSVSPELEWSADGQLVDVGFRVFEGPQSIVDRIVVRGNRRTDADVIRRSISVGAGDPVSARQLLGLQRELFGLGIFSRAQVSVAPGTPYTSGRDLLVEVEEGRNRRVTYGGGFDSEDGVRGVLGFKHSNLAGRGYSLQLDLKASQREQQFRGLFRQPFLGRFRVPVTYSLFANEEERESIDLIRRGVQVELDRFRGSSRFKLLFTLKDVEVTDPEGQISPFDPELQSVKIASLTPAWFIDRRDDPLNPTSGWSSNLSLEYAFPLLTADEQYLKAFSQQIGLWNLGRPGVLAASLRLGVIEPIGTPRPVDPALPPNLALQKIPISELFFAGGRTTHRAYRRDRLGIQGESVLEDTEVGGAGLLLLNLDYRFPLIGVLGGSVFADFGNVWADWREMEFAEGKGGAGVGLRYLSPVGPLRFDVGWKLDREGDEDPYVVFLSFGNAF